MKRFTREMVSHLVLRGRGGQEVLLGVEKLRYGLRDGRSALVGRLVDQWMGAGGRLLTGKGSWLSETGMF